jgi:hypothetical protein
MTANARITGKSGKEYFFQVQSIDEDSDCWPVNISFFAQLLKHGNTGLHEWMPTTKDKASYKLCLQSAPDINKDAIIEDLKEDGNYKIKIHYIEN